MVWIENTYLVAHKESKGFFLATLTPQVINFNPKPMDNADISFANIVCFLQTLRDVLLFRKAGTKFIQLWMKFWVK